MSNPPKPPEQSMDDLDREILREVDLEHRRRLGIKILPNALTTAAMFSGFYAIMQAISGNFTLAVWAVVVAGVFDMLDGRVARLVKGTSAFGIEYDSLSDLISFGFAPAMIGYFWALNQFGRFGWAVSFIYLACAAIRLAKFNTLTGEEESRRYFRGIPSPAAAGLVITFVMVFSNDAGQCPGGTEPAGALLQWVMLIWMVALGLLMISNIRFRTFKDINFKKHGPILPLAALAAVLAVFGAYPEKTLFTIGITYLTVGLVEGGIIVRRRERELRENRRLLRREQRVQRRLERKKEKEARRQAKLQRKQDGG